MTRHIAERKRTLGKRAMQARVRALAEFRYRLRQFLNFSEETADAAGTSAQQYQLLQVVTAAPDGVQATISYIAERMILRHNSAVELVGRAERSGLVRRQEDATDHRRALITLTEAGQGLLEGLVERHWVELERQGPELLRAFESLMGDGMEVRSKRRETR